MLSNWPSVFHFTHEARDRLQNSRVCADGFWIGSYHRRNYGAEHGFGILDLGLFFPPVRAPDHDRVGSHRNRR